MKTERVSTILNGLAVNANTLAFGNVTLKDYIEGRMRDDHSARITEWVSSEGIAHNHDLGFHQAVQPAIDSDDPVIQGIGRGMRMLSEATYFVNQYALRESNLITEHIAMLGRLLTIIFDQSERLKQLGDDDVLSEQVLLGYMTGSLRNAEPKPTAVNSSSNPNGGTASSTGAA